MIIAGVALALAGVVGLLLSGDSPPEPRSTTTTIPQTSTTEPPPTTTTTEPATTSTTVVTTTTTNIDAGSAIQAFVTTFADAIARQDVAYLLATLHPAVLALFEEETCRAFISEEILQLEQYRLIGEADGPTPQVVAEMQVEMYQAPVAFAFQGQEFTSEAAFSLVDGQVRWFTQCGSG